MIGPLADDKDAPLGNWRGQGEANSAVSLLEGVKAAVSPATRCVYAEGAKLVTGPRNFMAPLRLQHDRPLRLPAAVEAARAADVVVLAIGEDAFQSGEGRSQADIGLKGLQDELLRAVVEANKKVVVVLMSGRPLTIGHVAEAAPALVETWLLGSQSGHAIADVLFGDYNPTRQAAGVVPARRRPGAALLRPQEHRPAGPRAGRDVVALHGRVERPAVPVRLRPQLHDLHVLGAEG